MAIPDLSNLMSVARLRYIQAAHESAELRNPDSDVRHFIPTLEKWRTGWMGKAEFEKLRADPFYYYLVARTRYYDWVLMEAINVGIKRIVNVGCGTDTRSSRFENLLKTHGIRVLECDQAVAIQAKQRLARRRWSLENVQYAAVDLNNADWRELPAWLDSDTNGKTFVMLEGVSPYIRESMFRKFLEMLSLCLRDGSWLAYDFKLCGTDPELGDNAPGESFRLPGARAEVGNFHRDYGFNIVEFESSLTLCERFLPSLKNSGARLFEEDGLLVLQRMGDGMGEAPWAAGLRQFAGSAHTREEG